MPSQSHTLPRILQRIGCRIVGRDASRRGPVWKPATGEQQADVNLATIDARWPDPATSQLNLGFPHSR